MDLATFSDHRRGLHRIALLALIFGLVTVAAGGSVLFGSTAIRTLAGEVVSFVLWFNFLAGFLYILAAAGLWLGKRWALWLAGLIAFLNLAVLAALGFHITSGAAFEPRTVLAMAFRTLLWIAIFVAAFRHFSSNSEIPG